MKYLLLLITSVSCSASPGLEQTTEPGANATTMAEAATVESSASTGPGQSSPGTPELPPPTETTQEIHTSLVASGFYCFRVRGAGNDADPIGLCYRTREACDIVHNEYQTKQADVDECTTEESAYCYEMHDLDNMRLWVMCFDEMERCDWQRATSQAREPSFLTFSKCTLTR